MDKDNSMAEVRIAKWIANCGLCSRREAERLITSGNVYINGKLLKTPACKVTGNEDIVVNGEKLQKPEHSSLWLYHKPKGLVCSNSDEKQRRTIFHDLEKYFAKKHVISVGRLDINTEGLLLLTNNGALSRYFELPANGFVRTYKVRAYGTITDSKLAKLSRGVTIDGVKYAPIEASVVKVQASNVWIDMKLQEGKNREIKKVLYYLGLKVNRLIRTSYGEFELGKINVGALEQVPSRVVDKFLEQL